MKIALIGYGKMGQMIASVAQQRGHQVVSIIDPLCSADTFDSEAFRTADVAIEFSRPDAAAANVRAAMAQGVPVVSGTTGWDVQALRAEWQGKDHPAVVWSSNYSIGVNILFAINARLARLLHSVGGYTPAITEVHHVHKLDAPSGTAVSLREQIIAAGETDVRIESVREGEVPGIHEVEWQSEADILTLRHEAKSRKGFALGAVIAAEQIAGKRGWMELKDIYGFE